MSETDPAIFETTAPALGPGDDDPRSEVKGETGGASPLGPGDDDPRSPAKGAIETTAGPQAPGDGGDDQFHTLTPAAAGPGDPQSGPRTLTQIPRGER